jgi:hypothetical protein
MANDHSHCTPDKIDNYTTFYTDSSLEVAWTGAVTTKQCKRVEMGNCLFLLMHRASWKHYALTDWFQ